MLTSESYQETESASINTSTPTENALDKWRDRRQLERVRAGLDLGRRGVRGHGHSRHDSGGHSTEGDIHVQGVTICSWTELG